VKLQPNEVYALPAIRLDGPPTTSRESITGPRPRVACEPIARRVSVITVRDNRPAIKRSARRAFHTTSPKRIVRYRCVYELPAPGEAYSAPIASF